MAGRQQRELLFASSTRVVSDSEDRAVRPHSITHERALGELARWAHAKGICSLRPPRVSKGSTRAQNDLSVRRRRPRRPNWRPPIGRLSEAVPVYAAPDQDVCGVDM